ncbi:glutamate--tRNA ligase [Calidifontibacillus erzurumensis]|uniref:Glutamate--tRNA ligase n=1 Tax=Calidifontibacillus erzurumensis TaxID=2741433 RepID=A0A8J8KC33_9BACI|nr:glutamate--tRNA ligase [Calidifontibacillus erzurumensis]NSL52614.1 glutamate--tRNA ligase [Calidifontibacillus erzurumensis]
MEKKIRVRYAPSPTGHLHIGNARTALFNYLFARNQNGTFVIRIEDTDIKRNIPGGEQSQLKYLTWLGIDWDESIDKDGGYGPYRQMERLDIYRKYTEDLLARGLAYKCYCTEEELEAEREAQMAKGETPIYSRKCLHLTPEDHEKLEKEGRQYSIRFKVPKDRAYSFNDIVKGEVSFDSNGIGDFVIVKKDGIPTYNYAVVIDDHLMEISHVLRGDDHISNTPKQLMIYEAFGWEPPIFGHMTLIVNESHKKLSKRDETIIQFIEQYEELGYLPEALFNFIALLGWSPGGEQEIFTKEEFIQIFDPKRLSKAPAVFDTNKLTWMNNQYMKRIDVDRLVDISLPHLIKAGRLPEQLTDEQREWARELIALHQEKMSYGAEIVELTELFFKEELVYDEEAKEVLSGEQVPQVLMSFKQQLEGLDSYTVDEIKAAMKAVQKETGQKGKNLFMPIRAAVTGQVHGPDLPQTIKLLGKEKVIARLEAFLS